MAIELINCIKFRGKYEQVKYMANMGCDVNYHDDNGRTALHWCVAYNETQFLDRTLKIISFLIGRGANVNAKDHQGRTPLMLFILKNCSRILIFLLLDCGAVVTCKDMYLQTALHMYSSYRFKKMDVCSTLISRFDDINVKDINGVTPLMSFLSQGSQEEYIQLLLFSGSNVINKTNLGNTVLHYYAYWRFETALRTTSLHILNQLYGDGSLLNVQNSDGRTALMVFVINKLPINEVKYILDKGADINKHDQKLDTALHLFFVNVAIINPCRELLQMLLEYGANPNAINIYGNTPLSRALHYGITDYIILLYNFGLNRTHGRNAIGAYIQQQYPYSKAYQVVFKYMLLENQTALDDYITPEQPHYPMVRSYIDGLIEEVERMKTRILVHDCTLFEFTVEPNRLKYRWLLANCCINLKILEIEFPEYSSIIESKIQISSKLNT